MAVGVRNHSARVYLYPVDCHIAVLCNRLLSVQASWYIWSKSEKMHIGRAPKATQRVQNTPPPPTCSPTGHPTHKLGQGLSWFKCNFLGSSEITFSDLTETQRTAFSPGVTPPGLLQWSSVRSKRLKESRGI